MPESIKPEPLRWSVSPALCRRLWCLRSTSYGLGFRQVRLRVGAHGSLHCRTGLRSVHTADGYKLVSPQSNDSEPSSPLRAWGLGFRMQVWSGCFGFRGFRHSYPAEWATEPTPFSPETQQVGYRASSLIREPPRFEPWDCWAIQKHRETRATTCSRGYSPLVSFGGLGLSESIGVWA